MWNVQHVKLQPNIWGLNYRRLFWYPIKCQYRVKVGTNVSQLRASELTVGNSSCPRSQNCKPLLPGYNSVTWIQPPSSISLQVYKWTQPNHCGVCSWCKTMGNGWLTCWSWPDSASPWLWVWVCGRCVRRGTPALGWTGRGTWWPGT